MILLNLRLSMGNWTLVSKSGKYRSCWAKPELEGVSSGRPRGLHYPSTRRPMSPLENAPATTPNPSSASSTSLTKSS